MSPVIFSLIFLINSYATLSVSNLPVDFKSRQPLRAKLDPEGRFLCNLKFVTASHTTPTKYYTLRLLLPTTTAFHIAQKDRRTEWSLAGSHGLPLSVSAPSRKRLTGGFMLSTYVYALAALKNIIRLYKNATRLSLRPTHSGREDPDAPPLPLLHELILSVHRHCPLLLLLGVVFCMVS